jgi:hypothetical protein
MSCDGHDHAHRQRGQPRADGHRDEHCTDERNAGVGQKNNEITYVTTASTRKLLMPVRITRRKGGTMRRSAPTSRSAPSIAVTKAMIRKMLNSSLAATRLALKMAERRG